MSEKKGATIQDIYRKATTTAFQEALKTVGLDNSSFYPVVTEELGKSGHKSEEIKEKLEKIYPPE